MLSDLDKKILKSLNEDGRKSFRQVAKEVGTSSTAIYNNVKKLEKSGVINGYIPLIDPQHLGYNIIAIIRLRVNQEKEGDAIEAIKKFDEVSAIYSITGEWDQILLCYFKELQELDDFLINKLALPQVYRIVSHIVLNVYKDERRTLVK